MRLMHEFIKDLQNRMNESRQISSEINQTLGDGLKLLSEYGWYINSDMTLIDSVEMIKELKRQNHSSTKIDDFFTDYYNRCIEFEINKLKSKYLNRSDILGEAYELHKHNYFYGSVTLFLSQADGICEGELFKTKNKKSQLKQYLKKTGNGDFIATFLKPIASESSIDVYHPEKARYFSELNRHGVMHGYDTDFGTKTNSLKAFSLLCFVADFSNRLGELSQQHNS